MVDVFRSMSDVTQANASVLASGIWSALITTIMGLTIAIPVLMCYYYLMLKFRGFHRISRRKPGASAPGGMRAFDFFKFLALVQPNHAHSFRFRYIRQL